jgi:hypothetical protein
MRGRTSLVVALLLAVLLAGACGSRLPDQTLKAIDADLVDGGASRGAGGAAAASAEGAATTDTTAPGASAAAPTPAEIRRSEAVQQAYLGSAVA